MNHVLKSSDGAPGVTIAERVRELTRSMARRSDPESIARDVLQKLFCELAKFPSVATRNDNYLALAYAVRDRLLERWVESAQTYLRGQHRTVVYLSAEYLIGPQLGANLLNLGIERAARVALGSLGLDLDMLAAHEEEPGLGNGGLGRLAACLMESLATQGIPAIGHGLRYEFGFFDQEIVDGFQVERTDRWLRRGNPWEVRRFDIEHSVGFGGRTERVADGRGGVRVMWFPERFTVGVPYDTSIPGHGIANTNFLRLWSALAPEELDLEAFQRGDYRGAVENEVRSERLSKVLYPSDASPAGKELRLEQQAFFVSCALQDCIRVLSQVSSVRQFAEKFAIQVNDTHPSLAIAELMRLLVDVHDIGWDEAWQITTSSFGFTNHTLMPEALERWPVELFARLLPRHLEIIYEINRRFLESVSARFPGDEGRIRRMSLIDEEGQRSVRMVHLATLGSHHINGVSALHTRLIQEELLPDFYDMFPDRFVNVTNGVSPRRFLALANPQLAALLDEGIGTGWLRDAERLRELESLSNDAAFLQRWRAVKLQNKRALADWLQANHQFSFDPATLLSGQCKRFHEYKRQHLNLLHVIWLWNKARSGAAPYAQPRTFLFAGKAAPDYRAAKLMIRLIHGVSEVIARDARCRDFLRVIFVPDFTVKVAQWIYPAADISEQISTAGTEASGTGNMKFALNGALTVGTLDGANLELCEAVGAENFFAFGLTTTAARALRAAHYRPRDVHDSDPELASCIEMIASGVFSGGDRELFAPLVRSLLDTDPFLVLADFRAYVAAQTAATHAHEDQESWARASVLNVARSGRFSSDRCIAEYARAIWRAEPVTVRIGADAES